MGVLLFMEFKVGFLDANKLNRADVHIIGGFLHHNCVSTVEHQEGLGEEVGGEGKGQLLLSGHKCTQHALATFAHMALHPPWIIVEMGFPLSLLSFIQRQRGNTAL